MVSKFGVVDGFHRNTPRCGTACKRDERETDYGEQQTMCAECHESLLTPVHLIRKANDCIHSSPLDTAVILVAHDEREQIQPEQSTQYPHGWHRKPGDRVRRRKPAEIEQRKRDSYPEGERFERHDDETNARPEQTGEPPRVSTAVHMFHNEEWA
jgi:hypothetical protein